jgi:hypothetical protein
MTLDELPGLLRGLAVRAGEAAIPGADAMGGAYRDGVKKALTALSHARGTVTPAPPGGPPAMESGALAASVSMVPASTPVVATAQISPHVSPRDFVQEFGMSGIRPVRAEYMRYYYNGLRLSKIVNVPERSYMRTTADRMSADGSLSGPAAAAFYASMWG